MKPRNRRKANQQSVNSIDMEKAPNKKCKNDFGTTASLKETRAKQKVKRRHKKGRVAELSGDANLNKLIGAKKRAAPNSTDAQHLHCLTATPLRAYSSIKPQHNIQDKQEVKPRHIKCRVPDVPEDEDLYEMFVVRKESRSPKCLHDPTAPPFQCVVQEKDDANLLLAYNSVKPFVDTSVFEGLCDMFDHNLKYEIQQKATK